MMKVQIWNYRIYWVIGAVLLLGIVIVGVWFLTIEKDGLGMPITEEGYFIIDVTSPMSQYSLFMSSAPGLPIETRCETDGEAADYEVHYKVNQGTFIIWTDEGFIKQVGKECSEVFGDHTVYWSPLAEAYPDNLDWSEIILEIQVVEKSSGEIVLSTSEHKIYQEGHFYALDQEPAPKQESNVLQEGLAVYALIYEEAMPLGRDGKPVESKMVLDPIPLFTHEDLAYVDWEQQAWYFTDAFIDEKLKDREMTSDQVEVSETQKDTLPNIEGAVLLGNHQ